MKLQDKEYYWIKYLDDSEWEIARYREQDNRLKCTDGSVVEVSHVFEMAINPIKRSL